LAGSFSEEAALVYAQRMSFEPEVLYKTDMAGVLSSVDSGESLLGIFPVVNSRGGLVHSAFSAMGKFQFNMIDEVWLEVYQCLLVLPGTKRESISKIISHPQAIAQCERYLRTEFEGVSLGEWDDTAKAAEDLAKGTFSETTAVIAPARSAQMYGLELLEKGIHDNHPNLTTFIVVTK